MTKEQLALLKVMERVIILIRFEAEGNSKQGMSPEATQMLSDLVDAIHNIPDALRSEDFDINFHTNIMLGGFEEKYQNKDKIKPLSLYKHILENEI